MEFFGIELEGNISRELFSSTKLSIESFTFSKNTVSSINLEYILTRSNIELWLEIVSSTENKQKILNSIIDFSTYLFHDIKCDLNSNHLVAKTIKPFIKYTFTNSLKNIETAKINTGLDRVETAKSFENAFDIHSKENTSKFLQKYKGMTDDKYCIKKASEDDTRKRKKLSYDECMEYKLEIICESESHIKDVIIQRYAEGTTLKKKYTKSEQYDAIIDNTENKHIFKAISAGMFLEKKKLILNLKKSSLNYIEHFFSSRTPRYIILDHLVIYYFEMMYVLNKHKKFLEALSLIVEPIDNIEEYGVDYFQNKQLPITKEMYSLYALLNKKYLGANNTDVLSLLSYIAMEELEVDYTDIKRLLRTIFYGSSDGGKHVIYDIERADTIDIYEITWRNYMNSLKNI